MCEVSQALMDALSSIRRQCENEAMGKLLDTNFEQKSLTPDRAGHKIFSHIRDVV